MRRLAKLAGYGAYYTILLMLRLRCGKEQSVPWIDEAAAEPYRG